jgi:signal transduction histidine kinase
MMIARWFAAYDRLVTPAARGQALAARAAAWYSALPGRRKELVQDTVLALALAVVNLLSLLPYLSQMHPQWLALFLVAVQPLPLIWRRRWPVLALICSGLPRNLYDQLQFGFAPLPLAQAIAFATVAERSRPWLRWVTLVATAGGIAYSQTLPGHTQPYDTIVQAFIFGTAWAVGMLGRSRRALVTETARRAERAEAELDAAAARAASAGAAERARIARELHDVVAHHVSLIAVQAEAMGALLPARPAEASRSADLIAATARQAMTELRRLLGVLRAPSQSQSSDHPERGELTPAASLSRLEEVLDAVRGAGLPVSYTVSGSPGELSPSIDLTAYRIVQEALTNTLRHAPGSSARVDVSYDADTVTVRVTDTGAPARVDGARGGAPNGASSRASNGAAPSAPGAPGASGAPAALASAHGYGLAGIAERVASCGGSLTVGPVSPFGFAVTARLPVR